MTHEAYIEKRFQPKSLEVIESANVIIDELQAQGFTLTLRQLYYQFVARGWLPNRQASYNRLGTIVSDARLAGLISWDALEDRTRFLRGVGHQISPSRTIANAAAGYRLDKWEGAPVRVEVWIEKDALVGVIERVCTKHDVNYFACRGYEAATAHLTPEEDGIYNRLLRLCWRTPGCSIPNDADWIARRMRMEGEYEAKIEPILRDFFQIKRGRWSQKKQRAVYRQTHCKIRERKLAGTLGGLAKSLKTKETTSSKGLATRTRTKSITRTNLKINNKKGNGNDLGFDMTVFPSGPIGHTPFGDIAREHANGWDVNIVADDFRPWAKKHKIKPENMARAFPGFCKSYGKNKGPA